MLSKLLLSAFISISLRTANVPENPTDYQFKTGIKSDRSELSGERERENGIIYDGFRYRKSTKNFYADIIYKQAYAVDSQVFVYKIPVRKWNFGAGINSQKWDHGRLMALIQYSDGIIDLSYQIASSRQIIDSKVSEEIPLKGNFYLEPLALYHYEKIGKYTKDFWQAKLMLLYKFET